MIVREETEARRERVGPEGGPLTQTEETGDPVLDALGQADASYRQERARWARQLAALRQAQDDLAQARQEQERSAREAFQLREQLAAERKRAARLQGRARQLADSLKDIHGALFGGNVFSLILKACMTITQSTRGLYLTAWGEDSLRVRAAIDMDGYPEAPPSQRVRALCRKATESQQTFVCNDPACMRELPAPERPEEDFRNCLVAPAVVLKNFSGLVLLADKVGGDYDEDDVEQVLGVGSQAAVALENQRLRDELLGAYFSTVAVLADAVEAKDPYTHGHCEQVARLGRRVAQQMGLEDGDRSVVCFGGLLHDVGKIGVSDGVLNKPGKLLPEEWDLMRSHVRVGRDLLARIPVFDRVADVVLHHHERYDGKGYPEGLSGEQISLAARIIAVVDAYSAMTTKRSYKESLSDAEARAELVRGKGSHFDPAVVDAFLAVLDTPDPQDDCPDGCGLPPHLFHPTQLSHALQGAPRLSGETGG